MNIIKDAINKIFENKYSNLSFEELYRTSYTLIINRHGDSLYEEVNNAISRNLGLILKQMKPVNVPDIMLANIKEVWTKYNTYISVTNDILMYMDRNYISRNRLKTVHDMGYQIFRESALKETGLIDRLHKAMISEITKDRNGEYVEKINVKEVALMLCKVGLNMYEDYFECHFLEQTRQYYSVEVQKALAELACHDYIRNAEQRLSQEDIRCEQFLSKTTCPKLKELLIDIFLRGPAKILIGMES